MVTEAEVAVFFCFRRQQNESSGPALFPFVPVGISGSGDKARRIGGKGERRFFVF